MDQRTYQRACEIFEELLDLEPPARTARVEEACAGDPALRRAVEGMLHADQHSSWFLEGSVLQEARSLLDEEAPETEPECIGGYRVVRRLGEGGMGVVYEAEQEHPRRRVAVKCIHPWADTEALQERFRFEAQALAELLHPGIPQVYEAGRDGGRSYLVMERVQGTPPLQWARERGLSQRGRVRLLLALCEAVAHAHAHQIVHCDLKPANVLVTDAGQPKVLDFGIAQVLRASSPRPPAGTLRYMSPEQLEGQSLPTPSWDVFALGVMAFELLSEGRQPFPSATGDRPRTLALRRQGPLPMGLRGSDLEPVVARALHPDPDHRYATVQELQDDLRRFLAFRPVQARARSPWYLTRLWARRNVPVLVVLAVAALALALWGGAHLGLGMLTEARAERRLAATEARVEALLAAGEVEEADSTWQHFAQDGEVAHTTALARGWLSQARRLEERQDWEAQHQALALAWDHAPSSRERQEALQELARSYHQLLDLEGLALSLEALHDEGGTAPDLELELALATRDMEQALALLPDDDPRRPVVELLRQARPLSLTHGDVHAADLDGDGAQDLIVPHEDEALLATGEHRSLGLERTNMRRSLLLPGSTEVLLGEGPRLRLVDLAHGARELWSQVLPAPVRGLVQADLDGDGLTEVYVGVGPRERNLLRIDPGTGAITHPHPRTDAARSDLLDLAVADLDQDGAPELLVGASAWRAWDLRVLQARADSPELEMVARESLGRVRPILPLRTPVGPRVLVGLTHSPWEEPTRLALLALRQGELVEEWSLPWATSEEVEISVGWGRGAVADLDGDGLEDAAVTWRSDKQSSVIFLRQLPSGGFASMVVVGARSPHALDLDMDGRPEIALELDKELWVLGSGQEPVPVLEVEEGRDLVSELLGTSAEDEAQALGSSEDQTAWTTMDLSQPLSTAWQVQDPLALRRVPAEGILRLEPWPGRTLARLDLEAAARRVGVELELRILEPELGSSMEVVLASSEDQRTRCAVRHWGGEERLLRKLTLRLPSSARSGSRRLLTGQEYPLLVRMVHDLDSGRTCLVYGEPEGELRHCGQGQPLTEGPLSLVLQSSSSSLGSAPSRMEVRVERLRLQGLDLRPGPSSPLLHLSDGRAQEALDLLGRDAHEARAAALADLGRLDEAAREVERLVVEDPSAAEPLLRSRGRLLVGELLRGGTTEWIDAWAHAYDTCLSKSHHRRCREGLTGGMLSQIPGTSPAQRLLLLHRAQAARQEGEAGLARAEARRLLDAPEDEIAVGAALLLASMAEAEGRTDEALDWVRQARERSPTPELVDDDARRLGLTSP